jgi:muramoyltetrapeptide carboxypeptidase LdcA involved in peptidoglycan recycling
MTVRLLGSSRQNDEVSRTAAGPLIGGNLDTLVALAAAGRMPETAGAIVFWEAAYGECEKVQRDLVVLDCAQVFAKAAGMVVGLPYRVANANTISALVGDLSKRWELPTIFGLSIGHTSPIATLPIGAMATLDPTAATLTIMEATVS